jgi:hypothetical protein
VTDAVLAVGEHRQNARFADPDGNTWVLQEIGYCPSVSRT